MSEMSSGGAPGYEPPRNPGQIAGVDKKWWIVGGGAAVLIVWYAYKRSAASAASSTTDPNALPSGITSGIDPSTGYSYASEYSAPYPQNAIDPQSGIPFSLEGPIDPSTGVPYSQEGLSAPSPTLEGTAWLNAAVAALTAHGVTDAHARKVLSEYLAGQPMTSAEIGIVEQALGLVGAAPGSPTVHRVATPTNHPKPSRTYTVKTGDTLTSIAKKYKISIATLLKLNPIIAKARHHAIHRGEVIKV